VGPTAPPGATLSVQWHPTIKVDSVHTMWSGVTNALSGLLCTSLSTLAPAKMYTTQYVATDASTQALKTYGALSQEAVCTENLSGLAQMLPCGADIGTAKFLDPEVLFSAPFHSMILQVRAFEGPPAGMLLAPAHVRFFVLAQLHSVL
jgi:GPI-anchor transamidase subunit T